ncbi:uncharacterized protein N7484_006032 [Penicillium longicatenatum]|uniref:uncharacterized protein n=1 Tax=Penicillium longicatenatum TaxID=1561947 RepID=UPI002547B856|nr:uncharacterized protein N7484_006032 [Penicillium longicatenatum]KAJ5643525.1 hypothetical protein N7484_006032 [Penicillium longicatenatum]
MASVENQFFNVSTQEEWVDFDQFLDLSPSYSDDYSANSISPEMSLPYEADMFANDLPDLTQPGFPEMNSFDFSHDVSFVDQSPDMGLMPDFTAAMDNAMFHGYQSCDTNFDFRQMVEAQAAIDTRVASLKEKRREAAIALHLQRLCDATALDLELSSDSNTSFSSPCWSDYMRESISPQPTSASPEQAAARPPSVNGGVPMEMVLDLNMNATANLPKKQKPRSQAQKENYIKARKYGACEKHKKQHKRCNCLEKAAARAGVSEVPMDVALKERPRPQLPTISTVPSPRVSGVSDLGSLRKVEAVRSPAGMTKKVMVKSPVNDPSISPTGVQPFTRATTKVVRNNSPHDLQYSTSFVLSPVPDTSQKARSSNNLSGHGKLPQSSGLQPSTISTSPQTNRQTVGLSPFRGASPGSTSSDRPTDAVRNVVASQNVRKTASTTCDSETGYFNVPGREVRRPRLTHIKPGLLHCPMADIQISSKFHYQSATLGAQAQAHQPINLPPNGYRPLPKVRDDLWRYPRLNQSQSGTNLKTLVVAMA